jgi:hypothetical protein
MSELREALEAAVEQEVSNEAPSTPEVQTAAPETSAPSTAPTSEAPVSTEAKTETGAAEVPQADAAGKKAEVPTAGTPPVEKPTPEQKFAHRVDRAPASWKKEAKGEWAALPLQARQEITKREMEIERVLNEHKPIREQMQQVQQTIQPFMARIQSSGVTPIQAIGELLKADYTLATANKSQRAQFMAKLIKDYDVDLESLDGALVAALGGQQAPQAQQGFDPSQIQQLVQQQLQQALAPIYQQRQQQEQQVIQQATTTVEQMALDPQYPMFDVVRQDMADLIEMQARRGIALSLEDAYHRAVKINPEAAGQMSHQATLAQANQQHLQAQKAKAAASSVSGAPAAGGMNQFAGDGSLRGSIEAAFGNLRT